MVAAALFDGTALDLLSHFQDVLASPEVDICGRQVVQAFVIASVIVVVDEVGDRTFQITGHVVVFKQQTALQREMPAFDLALGHRMIGRASNMIHAAFREPVGQIAGDVT